MTNPAKPHQAEADQTDDKSEKPTEAERQRAKQHAESAAPTASSVASSGLPQKAPRNRPAVDGLTRDVSLDPKEEAPTPTDDELLRAATQAVRNAHGDPGVGATHKTEGDVAVPADLEREMAARPTAVGRPRPSRDS